MFQHNGQRTTQQGTFSYVGENLAVHTGSVNYTREVERWNDEVADYDYATNGCTRNRVCGHYTQVRCHFCFC